jgi:LL-diaminopimelate aminotransferase
MANNTEIHESDPWFQNLFAKRIGGDQYGKSTKIYKFEKIKRAKRAAFWILASGKTMTWQNQL